MCTCIGQSSLLQQYKIYMSTSLSIYDKPLCWSIPFHQLDHHGIISVINHHWQGTMREWAPPGLKLWWPDMAEARFAPPESWNQIYTWNPTNPLVKHNAMKSTSYIFVTHPKCVWCYLCITCEHTHLCGAKNTLRPLMLPKHKGVSYIIPRKRYTNLTLAIPSFFHQHSWIQMQTNMRLQYLLSQHTLEPNGFYWKNASLLVPGENCTPGATFKPNGSPSPAICTGAGCRIMHGKTVSGSRGGGLAQHCCNVQTNLEPPWNQVTPKPRTIYTIVMNHLFS